MERIYTNNNVKDDVVVDAFRLEEVKEDIVGLQCMDMMLD